MAKVREIRTVQEGCRTCFYGPNAIGYNGKSVNRLGCAHADRQRDWMKYAMFGGLCPSYWLDQNRFERV